MTAQQWRRAHLPAIQGSPLTCHIKKPTHMRYKEAHSPAIQGSPLTCHIRKPTRLPPTRVLECNCMARAPGHRTNPDRPAAVGGISFYEACTQRTIVKSKTTNLVGGIVMVNEPTPLPTLLLCDIPPELTPQPQPAPLEVLPKLPILPHDGIVREAGRSPSPSAEEGELET